MSSTLTEYSTPTIKGTISIPDNSSVSPEDVYVKVMDSTGKTVTIQKAKADKTFVIQNLNADMTYRILFTSEEPEFNNRSLTRGKSSGVGGWLDDVVPAIKEGNDVGNVKMKPLGTINGRALVDGQNEHYDIEVYIPGTSYIAKTDKDGSFSIYNVPEGSYTLRYVLDDHVPVMLSDISLVCPDDAENPSKTVGNVVLYSNKGTVEGRAILGDASDSTGITIKLESEDKSLSYDSSTSSDGSYVINDVTPGTYRIIASYSSYLSQSTSYFTVDTATITMVNETLELLGNYGTISGTASLRDSTVKDGIQILIKDTEEDNSFTILTDTDGSFIKKLKPGNYTVTASYPDYISRTKTVVVVEDKTTNVVFESLIENYGKVIGSSASTDETVALLNVDGTPVSTIQTSDSKTYSFEKVTAGTYSIKFSKVGYASYVVSDVSVVAGETTTVNGQSLTSSYGRISGTSNSEGETVSLLKDTSVIQSVVTGTDRTYEFGNLVAGTYTLRFSKYRCTTYESSSYTVKGGSNFKINGERLVSIYGIVIGSSSSSGETITLINDAGTPVSTIQTSDSKTYSFEEVTAGTYSVKFSKDGYASYVVSDVSVVAGETTTVNGQSLTSSYGRINGTSNSEGETVSLLKDSAVIQSVITGTDRAYEFSNIAVGTYQIRFSKIGYSSFVSPLCTIKEGSSLTIDGQALVSLYGTICGKSYSIGETVYLVKGTQQVQSKTTQESREYTFIDVEPGDYILRFTKDDYTSYDSTSVTVEAGQTCVVNGNRLVPIYGSISGTTSSEGEFISLVDSKNTTIKTVQNNGDRLFSFTRLNPGTYSLSISKEGYFTAVISDVVVVAGEDTSITTPELVSTNGIVSGFVILEGSSDYSGVTVSLTNSSDAKNSYVSVSGKDGSFIITGIKKSGTYLLSYFKDGYVTNLSNSVDITVGKITTAQSVTLKSVMSTVYGKIQLEGASSHEDTTILLKNESNQYTATTDQKGEYKINRVLPGTYTLLASKDGYVTASTNEFVVESSSEKKVDLLSLSVAIRSITGSVELELLSDYSGALVTATNLADSTDVYSAITNSAGTYTLAGMTPGEYSIVISYTGYRTTTLETVNVVKSTVTTIPLTGIKINRGTITGVAKLEGRNDSIGVKVELLRGSSVYAETATDNTGNYSFYVPQGNYTGVRYSLEDFASTSISKDIALFANNYISMGNTTLTATHNSIYGTVDVLTTEDESNVTISFDGVGAIESYITASDGSFRFDHVPVGTYTLRIKRQDCSDITIPVTVKAADGINLGKIEVTPNTATIKGQVYLENGLSLSKVNVSVDMGGGKVLETLTDDGGRYEIGGVSIADEYIVTYSKDGWDSGTQKISPKLNILEVRELDEITLKDTAVPVITSVIINNGANTTSDKEITLNLTALDNGSGLDKIMVTIDNKFDKYTRQYDYTSIFNWELPAENGEYTVYVKAIDRSGNVSESFNASIKLTDQKTEVSGVLSGDKLTWTIDKSPYLVTSSIMVEEGTTLIIEPGVDVQFEGNFGLTVEGKIRAIGTEEKTIEFYGIDEGEDNWIGINCREDNSSILEYVCLNGTTKGLQGYVDVLNSALETKSYALFGFNGRIYRSKIEGGILADNCFLIENEICVVDSSIKHYSGLEYYNIINSSYLSGNSIAGNKIQIGGCSYNNIFKNIEVCDAASNVNCTFVDCVVRFIQCFIYSFGDFGYYYSWGSTFLRCNFEKCDIGYFNPTVINDSNIIDCSTANLLTLFRNVEEIDVSKNFWGYANTLELQKYGLKYAHSFIKDYYSSKEFNITKANLSNYRIEKNNVAGYKSDISDGYSDEKTETYIIGQKGPAGGIVFFDKGYYSDGWRYLEAACSDVDNDGIVFGFYKSTPNSEIRAAGTSSVCGSGKLNTEIFANILENSVYYKQEDSIPIDEYAVKRCCEFVCNGYDDWFIPSKDELNLMYVELKQKGLGNFNNSFASYYWSSTEYYEYNIWIQDFSNGNQESHPRGNTFHLRLIRRF